MKMFRILHLNQALLIVRYSVMSLIAYGILIRLMLVSTQSALCYTGALDPKPEIALAEGEYSLVAAIEGWRRIEEMEDVQQTLRVSFLPVRAFSVRLGDNDFHHGP